MAGESPIHHGCCSTVGSSSEALDYGVSCNLIDLYHRAAIFHNLIGSVYYHKSQYGLGIQHFRRGVELLIKEERQSQQMLRVPAASVGGRNETSHYDLAVKCTEMERIVKTLQAKYDAMFKNIPQIALQLPCSARFETHTGRREPILIDGSGRFHFLKSDGTSSPASLASSPTHYGKMNEFSSQQLSPSVVSSVIIHNLSLCQSCIGKYSTALELIHLSRETAFMACASIVPLASVAEATPSAERGTKGPPQWSATPFFPFTSADGLLHFQNSIELLHKCLDQVERRVIAESTAECKVYMDKSGEAAPAA